MSVDIICHLKKGNGALLKRKKTLLFPGLNHWRKVAITWLCSQKN